MGDNCGQSYFRTSPPDTLATFEAKIYLILFTAENGEIAAATQLTRLSSSRDSTKRKHQMKPVDIGPLLYLLVWKK